VAVLVLVTVQQQLLVVLEVVEIIPPLHQAQQELPVKVIAVVLAMPAHMFMAAVVVVALVMLAVLVVLDLVVLVVVELPQLLLAQHYTLRVVAAVLVELTLLTVEDMAELVVSEEVAVVAYITTVLSPIRQA